MDVRGRSARYHALTRLCERAQHRHRCQRLTSLYRSLCSDTRAIRHHSAAAELEQALLHAWFVRSMPGTPELRATSVTCREAADMVV